MPSGFDHVTFSPTLIDTFGGSHVYPLALTDWLAAWAVIVQAITNPAARNATARMPSTLTDLVDVADVFHVVVLFVWSPPEPGVQDLLQQGLRDPPQRQRQHVRVVPLACAARGFGVVTQRGP